MASLHRTLAQVCTGHSLKLVPILFGHKVSNACTSAGDGKIVHESQIPFDKLKSEDWVGPWTRCAGHANSLQNSLTTHTCRHTCFARDRAFMDLLKQLPQGLKDNISSLCIDGTSSTALLVDSRRGDILAPTKIYNEDQGAEAFEATKVCSVST